MTVTQPTRKRQTKRRLRSHYVASTFMAVCISPAGRAAAQSSAQAGVVKGQVIVVASTGSSYVPGALVSPDGPEHFATQINSENYSFRMIEISPIDGRMACVIEATPKREDKSSFRGRIWVDTEDYALARVEGEPAKNPSFWTKSVHFVQQYRKSGQLWFLSMTTSVTDVRIFGKTDVSIHYFDYKAISEAPNPPPALSIGEAQNVGH